MENTECFGTEPMPYEKAVKSAKAFGKEMPFVVYRGGVPVAFAMSSKSAGGYSTVSEVYTLPEHRGRGYASALVAHISRLTLEGGKIPLLYTDAANPASNKAYRNIGFVFGGQVKNYEFEG